MLMRAKDHDAFLENEAAFDSIAGEWQARIGAGIVRAWGFDEQLATAIADHEACDLIPDGPVTLTHVVAVANFLARALQDAHDTEELLDDLPTFGALALDKQTLAWMLAVSADEIQNLQTAFGA
jgi:HD-like signal output (HDOD) protein